MPISAIVVVEKGSEVGAHILSGAVIDPVGARQADAGLARRRRLPAEDAGQGRPVLLDDRPGGAIRLPNFLMPPLMNNHHCYIGSLGNVCRWLAPQGRSARRRNLSGLCRDRSALRRQRRGARHRDRRHGRRARTARTRTLTRAAWNCSASTRCSPKARGAACPSS